MNLYCINTEIIYVSSTRTRGIFRDAKEDVIYVTKSREIKKDIGEYGST